MQKQGGGVAAVEPAGWQRYWVVEWHAVGSGMQDHRASGSQVIPANLEGR